MSKGEILDILFKKLDALKDRQSAIFRRENVTYLKIESLSETGQAEWYELQRQSESLCNEICSTVMGAE
ncbi:MAG: hypothetical protein LBG96_16165 [Tannerella sp.]|jgi:hypothetical protein|nr:hypothetical protein [Tannerella sp.]